MLALALFTVVVLYGQYVPNRKLIRGREPVLSGYGYSNLVGTPPWTLVAERSQTSEQSDKNIPQ